MLFSSTLIALAMQSQSEVQNFVATMNSATSEELVEYIVEGLESCEGVSKVESEDSSFRVYDSQILNPSFNEFAIDEIIPSGNRGINSSFLRIKCEVPGCIDFKFASQGRWQRAAALNETTFMCQNFGTKIGFAIATLKQKISD